MSIKLIELSSYTTPAVIEQKNKEWVEYGVDNNYYQYLIDLYYGSPTNNSAIKGISDMIYGNGLEVVKADRHLSGYLDLKKVFHEDCLRNCAMDLKMLGQYAFHLVKSKDRKKYVAASHWPIQTLRPERCDENGEIRGYYFAADWSKLKRGQKPKRFDAFGFDESATECIYVCKPYSTGNYYFSPVDYQGGTQYANLEIEIANYHINNIMNGLAPSMLINFNNGQPPAEVKDMIESQIQSKFSGSSNAGKFIISFNDNVETKADITPVQLSDAHNQYQFLSTESSTKIMVAHRITSPMLLGIKDNSGFGNNAEELKTASIFFDNTVIRPFQRLLLNGVQKVMNYNGYNLDIYFKTLQPLEFTDLGGKELDASTQEKEYGFAEVGPRGGIRSSPKAPDSDTPNKNPKGEGSAKGDASTTRGAKVSERAEKILKDKSDEFNEKYKEKLGFGVNVGMLKAVFQRGLGAFNVSHSPKVRSAEQWALARVNAFLYIVKNGRPENAKYNTDFDLLPKDHKKYVKASMQERLAKVEIDEYFFYDYEEILACPLATQDLETNTINRNKAIQAEYIQYGPLNVNEPAEYYEDLAEHWKTSVEAAMKSNCGNCAAFDISPRMLECMPGELQDSDGELGYCHMHKFKCHSARTCYTWAAGGPIDTDDISNQWQQNAEGTQLAKVEMAESFTDYPESASNNARRALKWVMDNGWGDCGTNVGKARAHQLANKEPISEETVKRMAAFRRHQQNKDVAYSKGCGGLMWDCWGGESGISWAENKVKQLNLSVDKPEFTEEIESSWLSYLQGKGEVIGEEYELIEEAVVTDADNEKEYKFFKRFAEPEQKSKDDRGIYLIRYRYAPMQTAKNSRQFCKDMVANAKLGVVYRREDIDTMGDDGINGRFAPSGTSNYSIWKYKGGVNCHHQWYRLSFMRKRKSNGGAFLPLTPEEKAKGIKEIDENYKRVSNQSADSAGVPFNPPSWDIASTKTKDLPNGGSLKNR